MEHRTTIARGGAQRKSHGGRTSATGRGVLWRRLGVGLVLAALLALGLGWPWLHAQSRVAASYGAKVGCSCHYIDGRSLADCRKDFEPGMGPVWLSENAATHTITARYAILASQKATWSPGPGCTLEPWKD